MRIISQAEAAKLAGVSQVAIQKKIKGPPRPAWAFYEKSRRSWKVDADHPEFLAMIGDCDEAEADALSGAELDAASRRAQLEIHIQKVELNKYKIEQERLKLEQAAGKLIEWELCEFLFSGYLERVNRELLQYPTRLEKKIELSIQEGIHAAHPPAQIAAAVRKLIVRENEAVIRDVKASQKKEVLEWQEDRS